MSRSPRKSSRLSQRLRCRRATRRGTTLVQTAIALPVMLLFLFGILEFSRFVMLLQVMNNAAREGCRYAVMHTNPQIISGVTYGNADSDVKTLVTNCLAGQALSGQATTVYGSNSLGVSNGTTWQNTQNGQFITVKITGNFVSLLSTFLHMPGTLPITAESVMRSEGN
jgi:Flp pilus assembly protein TadG